MADSYLYLHCKICNEKIEIARLDAVWDRHLDWDETGWFLTDHSHAGDPPEPFDLVYWHRPEIAQP